MLENTLKRPLHCFFFFSLEKVNPIYKGARVNTTIICLHNSWNFHFIPLCYLPNKNTLDLSILNMIM